MLTDERGYSPTGSNVCRQRQPRNICAKIPNGKLRSIHVQSISSVMTCRMVFQSSARYIQYSIAPPSTRGMRIFKMMLLSFICGDKGTNKRAKMQIYFAFFRAQVPSNDSSKVRINENNTKGKLVFLFIVKRKYQRPSGQRSEFLRYYPVAMTG